MSKKRTGKLREAIRELASKFFLVESNQSSLITITDVDLYDNDRQAEIAITVLPVEKEEEALSFARRLRTELRGKIMKELRVMHPPFIEIVIDRGEKNRQRIDEISQQTTDN